ncbi:MAG: helix-turn-helix domain-containing protein [Bacillota bacterium]
MGENPIRVWRVNQGISLPELARRLGVSYVAYWRLEKGYNAGISAQVAAKLEKMGYPGNAAEEYKEWRGQFDS